MAQFKPKFSSGQHAGVLVTQEEINQREKHGYTRWVNMYLKVRGVTCNDLFRDLADGNILAHLMEVLTGESSTSYGRMKFPADMRIQQIANLSVVFSFMKQHVKLVSIGPQDILEGDEKRILGLVWTLIEHFAVIMINAHLQTDIRSYAELKETLLAWARHKVSNDRYKLEVVNFTDSLADGRVFLALLNDGNPKECKYAPDASKRSGAASSNLASAFSSAEAVYGLSAMMDPSDPYATQCEQVSIIYMASLYLALPSEFDLLTTRVFIYLRVMRWWRRIQPAVHFRKVLSRARIAMWARKCFARWRFNKERVAMVGIKAQWLAQKDEIATLRAQLERMKQMYSEVGKKAGALPEVMGKFSELQSYAKSLKAEYERRIGELEEHIDKMAAAEEQHVADKESAQQRSAELEAEVNALQDELASSKADNAELEAKHGSLAFDHAQCEGVTLRLQVTIDEQALRIEELESTVLEMEEVREKNKFLAHELGGRDGTLAENEEQLEEMEEHVENLSAAMVASEGQTRKLQEDLEEASSGRQELAERLDEMEKERDEAEKELADTRDELAAVLTKLEGCQDEVAELTTENGDVKQSNDRIDSLNEELRAAVTRLTEEKKALESTRESLKDAIEDMQSSAKTGTEHADACLVELGRDFERARAKLGQLRTSFDGRSVIDDVVCVQHVCKLLCAELEGAYGSSKESVAQLSDWRTRHATKTTEHAELARVHSDVTSTKEQLLVRNEELEAEAERLRKDYDETEYALAEATSRWMHLEQERSFFSNAAKKINRHATASLKSGQLAGILVSSVSLALEDLAAVKAEAVANGLGLGHAAAAAGGGAGTAGGGALAFLDVPVDEGEKGEMLWSEELIQMLCTEIDGLRRTIREREITLGDKTREITGLEAARLEISEMRNETECARDAFYEHKESWEKSITAELTAQVTALREQVAAFEDEARKAKQAVSSLSHDRGEHASALERMRVLSKSREDELVDQLEALALKHTSEVGKLKNDLAGAEQQLGEQMKVVDRHRTGSLTTSTRLEEHEAEMRTKQRLVARLEASNAELEAKLEESEQVANRARALAREKGDLEGQLRALSAEHDNVRGQLKGKVVDIQGAVSREQEKETALETAAARYMQQQMLLDELHSRSEELTKHAQAALLKLTSLKAMGDVEAAGQAIGRLDRESEVYRAELEANLDLNPALAELMFARHLMNKLEAHVFALREEDAMKAAEFAAAHQDVASTREEMEELLDSHQGVVNKMKSLQEKARTINESLQEKARALDEATAAIDELEAKSERLHRTFEQEKKNHTTTKLERDEVAATLEAARADHEAEVLELRERMQLAALRQSAGTDSDLSGLAAAANAEVSILKRKLEEKEKGVREGQARLREAEARNRELSEEVSACEEKVAELRAQADGLKERGASTHGLREQVVLLSNEKERAEQDVAETLEAMARLEEDTRNPRLLSVRRAGQMQHIMYEITDLENKDIDGEEMEHLRKLHEDMFNIFEDTLCYLKGGMLQLTPSEVKKMEQTLGKCKDPRQCINIFKEAHLSCKKIVVSVAPSNTSVSNAHWTIPNLGALDAVPENKYMELLKNIRNLLVAHDMMDDESRSRLSTFAEIMMNLDWLVILGHKAIDVEMARKNKALRRAYGTQSSSSASSGYGGGGNESMDRGGRSQGPGSDSGSVRSSGYGGASYRGRPSTVEEQQRDSPGRESSTSSRRGYR